MIASDVFPSIDITLSIIMDIEYITVYLCKEQNLVISQAITSQQITKYLNIIYAIKYAFAYT